MGCNGSRHVPTPDKIRRNLTVASIESDASHEAKSSGANDEERGFLTALQAQNILQLLQQDNRHSSSASSGLRKSFSYSSQTDKELNQKESFADKTLVKLGDPVDPTKCGIGFTCRKGLKPESPNQDSWCVVQVEDSFSVYGVFDGHGRKGHEVSSFVQTTLPKLIVRDCRFMTAKTSELLVESFQKMQALIAHESGHAQETGGLNTLNAEKAGTTATLVVHDYVRNKITIAHVGDSTAVLAKTDKDGGLKAVQLTRDHKPELPDERERIENAGGRVIFDGYMHHRVCSKKGRHPGLNMSRCLGDLLGHDEAGLSCLPEVSEHQLDQESRFLLLCSDGVWEFITPQEAVDVITKYSHTEAMTSADILARCAWDQWTEAFGDVVDDITVVVVHLTHNLLPMELPFEHDDFRKPLAAGYQAHPSCQKVSA